MLNNLTNFFNLIAGRFTKKTLEPTDLIAVGTKDSKYGGGYKPTVVEFQDLENQLLSAIPPNNTVNFINKRGDAKLVDGGVILEVIQIPANTVEFNSATGTTFSVKVRTVKETTVSAITVRLYVNTSPDLVLATQVAVAVGTTAGFSYLQFERHFNIWDLDPLDPNFTYLELFSGSTSAYTDNAVNLTTNAAPFNPTIDNYFILYVIGSPGESVGAAVFDVIINK